MDDSAAVKCFEDLVVFQKAYATSLEVHRASLKFPKIEQFALADQIRRASKAICANIAEGFGRQRDSSAEFKRFLMMATSSSEEMQVWVRYARDLSYIDGETFSKWYGDYKEIARMLRGLHRSWK